MALRNTPAATTPFESEDEVGTVAQTEQDTAVAAEAAVPAKTAVAVQASRPVAKAGAKAIVTQNVLSDKKDAFHIEWDSVPRISAEQGSFVAKDDTEQDLGVELHIELMSYQYRWVASPNDKKADVELVKYSDDGIESTDGTNLKAHVQDLIEQGYSKAKVAHRCIIVGELTKADKNGDALIEQLIQVDLPESGRKSFEAYQLQASWAVGKGRKSAAEAANLTLRAVKDKTKSGEVYTKIVFS